MPNSSLIDNAVLAKALGDDALMTLLPDGAFFDEAGKSIATGGDSKRFLIVSLVEGHDVGQFGGRAYEDCLYLIEARCLSVIAGAPLGSTVMNAAAARIDALFEDQPLVVDGYRWMTMHREDRTRFTEKDALDTSIRWYRRGGRYRLRMSVSG